MKPFTYRISVIGAGAVGATLAQRLFEAGLADVVLIDVVKGLAAGKAMDLFDSSPIVGTDKTIMGTDDFSAMEDSDIVVITAGLPRKPGMSREDLISKNASIVKDISDKIKKHAPDSIVIVVTNPLDTMTYVALKTTGFPRSRVMGMAGVLDASRFVALLAEELKVKRGSIRTLVMGSHGDTMVPLVSKTFIGGKPLSGLLSADKIASIVKRTCDRGAEIVSLYGTGSAFYSPSAAVLAMIRAIMDDIGEVVTASSYLEGEYGVSGICMGVPCRMDTRGVVEVVKVEMSEEEKAAFARSAKAVKSTIDLL